MEDKYEHLVWPYKLLLPIINMIAFYAHMKKLVYGFFGRKPRINCFLGDGISISGRMVKEGATSWRALDVVYNFTTGRGSNTLVRTIDTIYMQIRSAQAPRNRLKMAMSELRVAIRAVKATIVDEGEPVRILSLAAGSAQGVISVMAEMKAKGINSKAILIDIDPTAIVHARKVAELHGVAEDITALEGDVVRFDTVVNDFRPDIVEMMGLTDYLRDKLAVLVFKKIRRVMKPGGFYFTSNVHPNPEAYFLKHVTDWDMIYRTKAQLSDLFIKAGFQEPRVITEPHGFQSFAVVQRTP